MLGSDGKFSLAPVVEGVGSDWYWESAAGHGGNGCAAIDTSGKLIGPSLAVTEGDILNLGAWVESVGVNSGTAASISLQSYDATTNTLIDDNIALSSASLSGDKNWQNLTATWTVPAGVNAVSLAFNVTGLVTGTVRFDDASVSKQGDISQDWVHGLVGDLSSLLNWIEHLVESLLGAFGLTPLGGLDDKIFDLSDAFEEWIQNVVIKPLSQLLAWLTGTNPEDWDTLEEIRDNLLPAIMRLPIKVLSDILGLVPIVGQSIENLLSSWLVRTNSTAIGANNGVSATNLALSITALHGLHISPDDTADVSCTWENATTDVAVTQGVGYWGFVRITRPDVPRRVFTYAAKISGSVTSVVYDVYSLDTTTGESTRVYTTPNQAGLYTSTYQSLNFTLPQQEGTITGDCWGIQVRIQGTGTLYLAGSNTGPAGVSNQLGTIPPTTGGRNTAGNAPDSFTASQMAGIYSSITPFWAFGSVVTPTDALRTISDNFGGDLSKWMLAHSSGSYDLKTGSGFAQYNSTTGGGQIGVYQTPLLTDEFDASIIIGLNGSAFYYSNLVLSCDANFQSALTVKVQASQTVIRVFWGGFYSGSYSDLYTDNVGPTNGTDARIYVECRKSGGIRTWKFYRGDDASGTPFFTWPDNSNLVPQGPGHRYHGIMIERNGFGINGGWIDNFMVKDVQAA